MLLFFKNVFNKNRTVLCLCVAAGLLTSNALADAPVVDAGTGVQPSAVVQNDSANSSNSFSNASSSYVQGTPAATNENAPLNLQQLQQQVKTLQQQVSNLTQMNMSQQVSDLQTQMQQINGQIQMLSHDMQTVNGQLRNFYQDLDQRIVHLKNLTPGATQFQQAKVTSSDDSLAMSKSIKDINKKVAPSLNPKVTTNKDSAPAVKNITTASNQASQELAQYRSAFNLMANSKYAPAMQGFKSYLKQYPQGKYAPNCYYWMGEVSENQNLTTDALNYFSEVVNKFPQSNKVADSQYKIALIYISQNKKDDAKNILQQIQNQYPNTTAAQLAQIRLQQITG